MGWGKKGLCCGGGWWGAPQEGPWGGGGGGVADSGGNTNAHYECTAEARRIKKHYENEVEGKKEHIPEFVGATQENVSLNMKKKPRTSSSTS